MLGCWKEESDRLSNLGLKSSSADSAPVVEQLFTLARLMEGSWEMPKPVYTCFADLEKALNQVPPGYLWGCCRSMGCRTLASLWLTSMVG